LNFILIADKNHCRPEILYGLLATTIESGWKETEIHMRHLSCRKCGYRKF